MRGARTYQVEGSSSEPLDSIVADIPDNATQLAAVKSGTNGR